MILKETENAVVSTLSWYSLLLYSQFYMLPFLCSLTFVLLQSLIARSRLENKKLLVKSPAWPILIFFPRIDDGHCNRIHSSLSAVHCFKNGYVRKQPVAWKEYCAEYWLKELQESMDRSISGCNITEILLKTALETIQSIINLVLLSWHKQLNQHFKELLGNLML